MKRWRIKNKRDWSIAACFLLLLSYLAASRYQWRVNDWLMGFSPEKMSYFNQPEQQGVYLLAVLLAAAAGSLLWCWQRTLSGERVMRGLLVIWPLALVLECGIWYSYQAECRKIVNTPYTSGLTPMIELTEWGADGVDSVELTGEERDCLLELCLSLQAPSEEEQRALRSRIREENQISLMIRYPRYKGHSYHLWFFLEGEILYLNRGHTADESVFYDGTEAARMISSLL